MAFPFGNLAALRTFRVVRALKTVAIVPGKCIHSDRLRYSCSVHLHLCINLLTNLLSGVLGLPFT